MTTFLNLKSKTDSFLLFTAPLMRFIFLKESQKYEKSHFRTHNFELYRGKMYFYLTCFVTKIDFNTDDSGGESPNVPMIEGPSSFLSSFRWICFLIHLSAALGKAARRLLKGRNFERRLTRGGSRLQTVQTDSQREIVSFPSVTRRESSLRRGLAPKLMLD